MKPNVTRHAVVQPLDQSIKLIPLTKGQNAVVSAHRYEYLNQFNWFAQWNKPTKSYYAAKGSTGNRIYMHRLILGLDAGDPREADHKESGQTLDNRDSNLRISTRSQNACNCRLPSTNTSGYKGVYYEPKGTRRPWRARLMINGKTLNFGRYGTREEAFAAVCEGAKKLHGEFANPIHAHS